jgi:hypothetical protein
MKLVEAINYSEFTALATCERKWAYAYIFGEQEEGARRGLHLGTLCHLWHSRWLQGLGATLPEVWTDDINTGGKPGEERTLSLTDFESELVTRATWLAGRFVACYGAEPPSSWNVISTEEWLVRDFGDFGLVGRTDGFVEIDGQLWLIEVKSFGSRPGPLAYAHVSPQLGCYGLLAEARHGHTPFGVLYQGIYTYQWKPEVPTQAALIEAAKVGGLKAEVHGIPTPVSSLTKADQRTWAKARQGDPSLWTERAPEESFEQLEVELGEEHYATAYEYLASAVRRRAILRRREKFDQPIPSVGAHCLYCGFKDRCWNDLGGVEPYEIEVEDESAEPV